MRTVEGLGVLLSLGLLVACTSKPNRRCDVSAVHALATELEQSQARSHPDIVAIGLPKACRIPAYVDDLFSWWTAEQLDAASLDQRSEKIRRIPDWVIQRKTDALQRACAGPYVETRVEAARLESSVRTGHIFDRCDFGRFGLVDRERFASQPFAPYSFGVYQWLLDQDVPADDARPVSQAVLTFERKHQAPRAPGHLPHTNRVFRRPLSHASLSLAPDEVIDRSSMDAVYRKGDTTARRHFALNEFMVGEAAHLARMDEPRFEIGLEIFADATLPWSTVVQTLRSASKAGLEPVGLIVEYGPWEYGTINIEPVLEGKVLVEGHMSYQEAIDALTSTLSCATSDACAEVVLPVVLPPLDDPGE
ncbi:MAG: hypothetical protein K0V04_25055 [Deltaproteobacteria bacterium]|nr:hypothetical protein [Deltaproteobacteria bacterium]